MSNLNQLETEKNLLLHNLKVKKDQLENAIHKE